MNEETADIAPLEEEANELPEGCTPTEWITLRWETVSSHRNLGCFHEGECLEYAGRRRWQGMSCKKCLVFDSAKKERKGGRQ